MILISTLVRPVFVLLEYGVRCRSRRIVGLLLRMEYELLKILSFLETYATILISIIILPFFYELLDSLDIRMFQINL